MASPRCKTLHTSLYTVLQSKPVLFETTLPGVCDLREMGLRFLYGSTGLDSVQPGAARFGTKRDSHSVQKRAKKNTRN